MTRKVKLAAIIVLCVLATLADSALYLISLLLDGALLSGVAILAWSLMSEDIREVAADSKDVSKISGE